MQLYQNIISKKPLYCVCKKIDVFMKCLYSDSFMKLDSFHDQRIEVMLVESIQGFSTKDIYIQQKVMFIISYIYQKAIVKESCSYSYLECFVYYRVIDLVESYVYYEFIKLYFLELYLKTLLEFLIQLQFYIYQNLFIY